MYIIELEMFFFTLTELKFKIFYTLFPAAELHNTGWSRNVKSPELLFKPLF